MFAAVDLGSNSFRLHIGFHDGTAIRVVKTARDPIRLGAGLEQCVLVGVEETVGEVDADEYDRARRGGVVVARGGVVETREGNDAIRAPARADRHRVVFEQRRHPLRGDELGHLREQLAGKESGPEVSANEFAFLILRQGQGGGIAMEDDAVGREMDHQEGKFAEEGGEKFRRGQGQEGTPRNCEGDGQYAGRLWRAKGDWTSEMCCKSLFYHGLLWDSLGALARR